MGEAAGEGDVDVRDDEGGDTDLFRLTLNDGERVVGEGEYSLGVITFVIVAAVGAVVLVVVVGESVPDT